MRSDGAPSRYDPFGPTLWQARLDVHVQEPQRALALLQAAAGPLDLEGLARAGSFQLDLSLTCGCPELRGPLHLSVQTSPAVGGTLLRFGLNLPAETRLAAPHVAKPAGRPLQVEAEAVLEDEQLAARNVTLEASYGDARLVTLEPAELRAASGGAGALEAMLRAGLHLGAVQQWLELAPALGRLLEQQGVEDAGGDLELRVALNASLGEPPRLRGCVQVDAGGLDVRSPYFAKPSGDPLELTADYWSEHAAADGGGLLRLHSRLSGGTLLCELRAPRGAPASAHVRLEADRVQDLRAVLPALPAEFEPQIWTQAATVDIETVLAGGGDDWKLRADLTGSRLALSQPVEFLKEPGTTATVVLQGRLQAAPQERRLSVDLTGGRVQVGESRIDIEQGSLELEPWAWPDASAAQPLHLRGGALQGRMALNLAEIGALAAGLGPLQLAGALRGAADVRSVEGAWQVMDAVLELEAAAMTPAARGRFTLDGVVTGAHGQWATPGLDVLLEGSEISLVVEDWRAGQAVQCHVHAPRVDLLALQAWSAGWDSAATRAALNEGRAEVYVRELLFPAIGLGLPGALQEFVGHVAWKDGNLSASGRGACAGGVIDLQLDGWPGAARWSYMLRSVPADAALARWLGQAFPSVIAEGDVSLECHSGARSTAGQFDETFAASGDLTVEGGRLRGKAAPSWVTWVFPQLNLASFEFTRLRDWFEVRSDGTIRHEALFQGRYYHLYATGEQRGRSEVHYELGIDLLAGLEDPYWAQARAGRIPLFDSRTRLAADGSILEETVNYVPLRFAVGLLWRSNPVYTAYHAIRKRAANDK
jgi:hypothetical protein